MMQIPDVASAEAVGDMATVVAAAEVLQLTRPQQLCCLNLPLAVSDQVCGS
jgi:hypothetical protein